MRLKECEWKSTGQNRWSAGHLLGLTEGFAESMFDAKPRVT
jgi:hypothetical protein